MKFDRFWQKIKMSGPNECWEWTGAIHKTGYGQFKVNGKTESAHRLAYIYVEGEISLGQHVMHTCDNRKCCNPNHLTIGTHQDNIADMVQKNRHRSSRRGNGFIKIDKSEWPLIKEMYEKTPNKSAIARKFNVTPLRIRQILGQINGQKI